MKIEHPAERDLGEFVDKNVLVIGKDGRLVKGRCWKKWRGIRVQNRFFWATDIATIETIEEPKSS